MARFLFISFFARYVRVYLLPDQRDGRQTPVQRKTQNPVFNHGFTYELAHREVLKRTLMLKVQDLNRSTHRHHVIGQVLLPLSDLNLIKGVHIWKRIRPTDQVSLYKQYRPPRPASSSITQFQVKRERVYCFPRNLYIAAYIVNNLIQINNIRWLGWSGNIPKTRKKYVIIFLI